MKAKHQISNDRDKTEEYVMKDVSLVKAGLASARQVIDYNRQYLEEMGLPDDVQRAIINRLSKAVGGDGR
jgi:hypothetical protein